jgi:hypothetical protein
VVNKFFVLMNGKTFKTRCLAEQVYDDVLRGRCISWVHSRRPDFISIAKMVLFLYTKDHDASVDLDAW